MVKCESLRINMFRITHTGKSVNFPVTQLPKLILFLPLALKKYSNKNFKTIKFSVLLIFTGYRVNIRLFTFYCLIVLLSALKLFPYVGRLQ